MTEGWAAHSKSALNKYWAKTINFLQEKDIFQV